MVQARNFKFGVQIDHKGFLRKKINIRSRIRKGSHYLLLKFWDSLHISGMVGARNFKFGKQIDRHGY